MLEFLHHFSITQSGRRSLSLQLPLPPLWLLALSASLPALHGKPFPLKQERSLLSLVVQKPNSLFLNTSGVQVSDRAMQPLHTVPCCLSAAGEFILMHF